MRNEIDVTVQNLQNLVQSDGAVICIKDSEGNVVYQNDKCLTYCGDRSGKNCKDGCMVYYAAQVDGKPTGNRPRLLPSCHIHNQYFDLLFLRGREHITTVLYPIGDNVTDSMRGLEGFNLTPREMEIAQLMLLGLSNRDMMKKLSISKSTLKTHVNRIYKKLGSNKEKLIFRSAR